MATEMTLLEAAKWLGDWVKSYSFQYLGNGGNCNWRCIHCSATAESLIPIPSGARLMEHAADCPYAAAQAAIERAEKEAQA